MQGFVTRVRQVANKCHGVIYLWITKYICESWNTFVNRVWFVCESRFVRLNRVSFVCDSRFVCLNRVSFVCELWNKSNCKVCVLSVSNFCVCLPCVVACLFPCLVLVLPCSRHVLSLCLFVCAMCPLVVVRVSTPHLFPISRVVCIIGFTCVLLIPLV